jgi:hypothetical protein
MDDKEKILKALEEMGVSSLLCTELRLGISVPRDITVCCTVSTIIKEYNGSRKDETRVAEYIEDLLELHFKK